jgi:hypothetical protein
VPLGGVDQTVHAYLLENGFLIDSQIFEISNSQILNHDNKKIENIANSSPKGVKTKNESDMTSITGNYLLILDDKQRTETILYLIIVTISLIGFTFLVRMIK